jgi:hypothetical protein
MSTRTEVNLTAENIAAIAAIRGQLSQAMNLLYGIQPSGVYSAPTLSGILNASVASIDSKAASLDATQTTFARNTLSKKPSGKIQKLEKIETSLFGDASTLGLFDRLRSVNK